MKKIFLLLSLFIANGITSQNGFTTYSATIPSGGTNPGPETALLIDNAGNKWVGYQNGSGTAAAILAFYDKLSTNWTFYNKTNTPALPIAGVRALCTDNANNIWVGTTAGLVKFDGSNWTLFTTANGLPANFINSLESFNNMLYIGTNAGLSRFDGTTFTNYTPGNTLFPFNNANAIKIENANTIWVGCGTNLVKFTINSTFTSTSYLTAVITNTAYSIRSIYVDGLGNKWLGTDAEPVMYDNTNFNYFSSMYPGFTGSTQLLAYDICKGPNNGILYAGAVGGNPLPNTACLVELMPAGVTNIYYGSSSMNLGKFIENDGSGDIFITISANAILGSNTPKMYSFKKSLYSPLGQGPGGGVNANNYKYLDINRVTAGIMNRGDMWWDIGGYGNAAYEVPNGNPPGSGVHGGFAAALWIGGLDASGNLHTSAQTYRQTGSDFWPGPLDTISGTTDTAHVIQYDKIWKVSYTDINNFITQYNLGNVPTSYTPTPDMVNWPAAGSGNNTRNMAPFVDVNGDGIYDWKVGDYPKIKGDQTLYYIFSDNSVAHTETNGLPLAVEVHAMAYAYGCGSTLAGRNELAYTTFYDYKIYNRSNTNYNNVYIGFWTDVDMGCYKDDYIGSDPNANLGFCYNSTNVDQPSCSGANAYVNYPPAAGTTVLKGPKATPGDGIDNNNNGVIDEANEECLMNIFDYYNNNIGGWPNTQVNPVTGYHYYNYLRGQWKDSTFFTCGGNAYGGTTTTKFVYPENNYTGNPCSFPWNEYTAGNLAGDRRYIVSSGPFNFPAQQMTEVEYAYVWSRDTTATTNQHLASMNKLISDTYKIRSFYSTTAPNCLLSINIGIKEEQEFSSQFNLFPNPGTTIIKINAEHLIKSVSIIDISGRTIISNNTINSTSTELNIESLANGVYFVKVNGTNWSNTRKLIKQ
jgi:hypothetical protein